MNTFTAVLTVISGVTAFYITSVVEEVRTGPSASYEVKTVLKSEGRRDRLFYLENLSRVNSIRGARFRLYCRGANGRVSEGDCFEQIGGTSAKPVFVSGVTVAPNFAEGTLNADESAEWQLQFCVSAVPSSKTAVRFRLAEPRMKLVVIYDPWSEECGSSSNVIGEGESERDKPLLLLDHDDLHAVLARHYFTVFFWAMLLSAAYLAITLFVYLIVPKEREETGDDTPESTGEFIILGYRAPGKPRG